MSAQAARKKQVEKYKPLILKLEDMGFTDRKHSFNVLVATKGNMDKAIEKLTANPGSSAKKAPEDDGLPNLLVTDPFGLDTVGDLLNDNPGDPFQPTVSTGAPSLIPSNIQSAMNAQNSNPGLMNPNRSMGTQPGAPPPQTGGYQSAFMVGQARQQQQRAAPSGPSIGGMCRQGGPAAQPPGRPTAPTQPAGVPGLLTPTTTSSPGGMGSPARMGAAPMASSQPMWPNSQPSSSLPSAPQAAAVHKLPPGSLSFGNLSSAPPPAASGAPKATPKGTAGFGSLLSDMKQSL